ncbi:MAG: AarF/ABC1/UbiB kinase family protein [Bacteroidetes bacterium]|nr:AarF/ABC1/UbiB kinase family protein [Bacteroidota bacterium]
MFIFRLRTYWHQFWRALGIIGVLLHHGLYELLVSNRYTHFVVSRKKRDKHIVRSTEERIRLIIEDLGPTYIKFGQILADRPDLISESLRKELKKLQSTARPIDDNICVNLLQKELGAPLEEVFLEFDKRHIASASIGQTYVGKLITGERVVIKVQRPNIEAKIKLDLLLLRFMANQVTKNYPELAFMGFEEIISEFGDTLLRELNYLNEASNQIRFGEMFKMDPNVHIPRVYTEFTTRKILIMEHIDGIPPDDIDKLLERGYDLNEIAKNGAQAILQMIFVHGYFHADPHPGNIFVMRNNVVAFIDFGMVGTLKPAHMDFLAGFILGFAKHDPKMITRALLRLSGKKFYEYSEELEFEVEDLIKRNSYLPYERMDFAELLMECINIVLKYKLHLPSSIYLLLKSLATIQRFAEKLGPDISFAETILPYAKELILSKYTPKKMAGAMYNAIGDYLSFFRNLPNELNEILGKAKDGKLVHEINLHDTEATGRVLRAITRRISMSLLMAALLITSTLLITNDPTHVYARAIFIGSSVLAMVLIIRYLITSNTRR